MQKEINITNYLNEDYSSSALYLLYRATPSYIDGLKNSGRKVVYTIKKKNIKDSVKVTSLGGLVTSESNYLHGDSSIEGVIVTAGQDYTGSNNLPYLKSDGNFGSRHMNQASASRYIFAQPQEYFGLLFKKEDDINLIGQEFEGSEIEPRYYVPTLPLILINGVVGLGVGFSTKILNRNPENIVKYLRNKMDNIRNNKNLLTPYWNGFTGEVLPIEENKWEVRGVAKLISKKKLEITELPITYDLLGYIDVLKKLKEKNVITSFYDLSEDDKFHFEIMLSDEESNKDFEEIFKDLKLTVNITEILTCLDENNSIIEFNNSMDIINKYYDIKIDYLNKRIKSEIERLTKESNDLGEISKFIKEIVNGTINIKDKKAKVEEVMRNKGYTLIDKLLGMPIYSITEEKAIEAENKYKDKIKELEEMKNETAINLWKKDLDEIEKYL